MRVEMPVLVQSSAPHRLAHRTRATIFYDLKNALFCGKHSSFDECVERRALPADRKLLMSRHNEATLRLCPELGQAAIDLAVGSGAPPGDSNSADAFGDLF